VRLVRGWCAFDWVAILFSNLDFDYDHITMTELQMEDAEDGAGQSERGGTRSWKT